MPTAAVTLAVIVMLMLVESGRSIRHEASLRARGAEEAPGDVFGQMRWLYPACFVAMAIEGAVAGVADGVLWTAGALTFVGGKLLKYWAVAVLGDRWTFRVLRLPGAPLVRRGPYRLVRHPNYLGVMGEIAGMALMMRARVTGSLAVLAFGFTLARRIRIEENWLRAADDLHQVDRLPCAGPRNSAGL